MVDVQTINVYFDFADPLSYVISTQVGNWARSSGYLLQWQPLKANYADVHGWDVRFKVAEGIASELGFPLYPRFGVDSTSAMRLFLLARDREEGSQFAMRVFQAWYATDLPPYSSVLFAGLLTDCGIPQCDAQQAIRGDGDTKLRLSSIAREAQAADIIDSPTLLVDNSRLDVWNSSEFRTLEHITASLVNHGIAAWPTRPARCYLPAGSEAPRFCRWCSCARGDKQ